ncbi:MAG: flagellar hook-length control protein FliK [Candidatus Accumulibacter sp.]|jgi:flagellar hook-length control protein FliK|nr:flagellar hook-length control protein FliK [Accumulibacter sp.]
MTIAIVSALPKTASVQASAPEGVLGAESGEAGLDFSALLLGSLAARPGSGLGASLAAANDAGDDSDAGDGGEAAATGDPLAFLAVLAQAPLEARPVAAAPENDLPDAALDGAMGRESPLDLDMDALAAGRAAQAAASALTEADEGSPASASAAKFAALVDAAADAAPLRETPEPAALAAAAPAAPARPAEAPEALAVSTPLREAGWGEDFAQKVSWIAANGKQFAELKLNPPAMGQIEISLKLDGDRSTAIATFVSASAEVRDSIEHALPKLREMLAGVGIALGQAQVSAESFRQPGSQWDNPGGGAREASPSDGELAILASDDAIAPVTAPAVRSGSGMVDMFV